MSPQRSMRIGGDVRKGLGKHADRQSGAHAAGGTMAKVRGRVGIFWFIAGKLLFDRVPLARAESYGPCLGYPAGHEWVWAHWQRRGLVPADVEYDSEPRGRVSFDLLKEHFLLMMDNCILQDSAAVESILRVFRLPAEATQRMLDQHYTCSKCLRRRPS